MTAQIFKERKKFAKKEKKNNFTCPEKIVKDLLRPKFHFILMTVTQHIFYSQKVHPSNKKYTSNKNENTSTKKIKFI